MRRFRSNKKGQFVVLAAIIMAAFMFSLVLTISQMNLSRQELSYEPIDETVLAITSDFERLVTNTLAKATEKAAESYDYNEYEADEGALGEVENWIESVTESYGGFGLKMSSDAPDVTIRWYENEGSGFSSIYTAYSMSIDTYGFEGLKIRIGKFVRIRIINAFVDLNGNFAIEFQLSQTGKTIIEADEPIPNLTEELAIMKVNNTVIDGLKLTYLGNGRYLATFNVDPETIVVENVTLTVKTPSDGIIVSAYKRLCRLTLQSLDLTTGIMHKGQMVVNGTTYNLPHKLQIFPGQVLNITFIPPGEVKFQGWSGGPFNITSNDMEKMNALFKIPYAGEGNITALYGSQRNATIILQSYEIHYASINNGSIVFNGTEHNLPKTIRVPNGTYTITYMPSFGYEFVSWEFNGAIAVNDTTQNPTRVSVLGNGTITAIYSKNYYWSTLYLDRDKIEKELVLVVFPSWSQDWGFGTPPTSYGQKQSLVINSSSTPELILSKFVNITLYMESVPPNSVKTVNITFGYYKPDGTFTCIGSDSTIQPTDLKPYRIKFETNEENRRVPEGSVFSLIIEATFQEEPYGTFKVYFGQQGKKVTISQIELFD